MATITTLRPSATSSGVGWTPSAGTLHGVTSDDNDATYAEWSGDGSALILQTPIDSPPAGERRHLVRLRARGEDGAAWWAVRLASGSLVAGAAGTFGSSPETIIGSWGAGAPADGSTILSTYVTGQVAGVKITELYLDVDSREAPTFTPQVLDGSGTPNTSISDTAAPTIRVSALDLDGLTARQYRYWVTDAGAAIVWDTGIVSGSPVNRMTTPLDNGTYDAHLQVWSTLGTNTAYASAVEDLEFTISVGAVPSPSPPTVTPEEPFYRVEACAPDVSEFDDEVGWVEIQRVDCNDVATTLAILGPLETDQCAEWVDFTLPRSGVGLSCDHQPEPCCSYYRARTLVRDDGSFLISDWSDAWNPGVPQGMIFAWPGTNGDIPSGWERETDLDGRYPRQVPNAMTQPGATGGAETHTHTTPGHVHSLDHSHTTAATTASATGTFNSHDGNPGTLAYPASHTHTRPSTNTASVDSGSTSPGTDTAGNNPSRLEVIWIRSNGNPLGIPDSALALMGDTFPSGWDTYADGSGRFLKGAGSGQDGGTTVDSEVSGHTHDIDAHTHGGTAHIHTSANTGATSGTLSFFAGPNPTVWSSSHSHPISVGSATTQELESTSGGTSGAAGTLNPPYRNFRLRQNTSGGPSLPVGVVALWLSSLGSIPDKWQLCDGTNGTPDMFGLHARADTADIGDSGGSTNAHAHTSPNHDHTTTGHSHTSSTGATASASANVSSTVTVLTATATHTHALTDTNSTTPTVDVASSGTLSSETTQPPYREVAFVQLMEEWEPPPAPPSFCLEWSDDEHLIRSTGPDGPIYAPVLGRFEWDVSRPFTAATGVNGGRFVTSAPPGGRNLQMVAAVESEDELATLRAVLARPLVLISPSDSSEVWAAPVAESVRIVKVGRIRQITASFIATGPEPGPQLADVAG